MRAVVSSILSEMSDPSPLCYPDYSQVPADHRRLLVLVRSLSTHDALKPKTFARVFEVLDRGARVQINAAGGGGARNIEARFVRTYPPENNEWGEFQLHRAVLGLVSVGAYRTQQEQRDLERLHKALKAKYDKFLLSSRLIALRVEEREHLEGNGPDAKENGGGNDDDDDDDCVSNVNNKSAPSNSTSPHGRLEYRSSGSGGVGVDQLDEKRLENDVSVFLTTIFWLLEKTRVDKQALLNQQAKLPLLCAPFERRDFVGLDLESRSNRRRTAGRFRKYLGDLNMLCGLPKEAYDYYESAADGLRSCNDWLWLANSLEGICSIATLVHFPQMRRVGDLRRNSSFQAIPNLSSLLSNRRKERLSGNTSNGDVENDETFAKRIISNRDLVDSLREIVVHYSKYTQAGVVETEASIKAVHVLLEKGNIIFASEFLQNVVFINLQMTDEEKVQRFAALSKLYSRLGFRRKAAFFHRVAAMRCVAPQNPRTDWASCYHLLLKTLAGYDIDFQAGPRVPHRGWPALQIQILQELMGTARRMGDYVAATRHMAFLVQRLLAFLSPTDRAEFCHQLAGLASRSCSDTPMTPTPAAPSTLAPTQHAIEAGGGVILPPVNIYTIPEVVDLKPCAPPEPLIPPPPGSSSSTLSSFNGGGSGGFEDDNGPFIFTPIVQDRDRKATINWVQGEVANVELTVINPLPVELKIESLALMHEGAAFDATATDILLPPDSNRRHQQITLSGIPREPGQLKITGYSCVIFGVRSHCRIKSLNIPDKTEDILLIDVCPSIPRLEVSVTSLNNENANVVSSTKANEERPCLETSVFHGETVSFDLTLRNVSDLAVERLETTVHTIPSKFRAMASKGKMEQTTIRQGDIATVPIIVKGPPTPCHYTEQDQCLGESSLSSLPNATTTTMPSLEETTFTLVATTKYSSSPETSGGYSRQVSIRLRVHVLPSLIVTWWDVLPGESSREVYVILDVTNVTDPNSSSECELEYASGKRIVIDGRGDTCRIPLPLEKIEEGCEEGDLVSYLDQRVDLQWRLQERRGRVSLAGIKLDRCMCERLRLSSVSWTVRLNGERCCCVQGVEEEEVTLVSGEPALLEVVLDNMSSHGSASGSVHCVFSVDCCYVATSEGQQQQIIPTSGPRSHRRCRPGEKVLNRRHLLPFAPGKLRISCTCLVITEDGDDMGDAKTDHLVIPDFLVNVS